jgi:hypothetical protein
MLIFIHCKVYSLNIIVHAYAFSKYLDIIFTIYILAFDFLFAYSDFHYFDYTLFLGRHCCEVRGVTWHCVENYLEVSFITFLPEILRACSYEG